MEPTDQLASILPTVADLVADISPAQIEDPTPCSEFTIHDILDHMVVLGGTFAHLFRGEEPPEITAPKVNGRVPVTEFRDTMGALLDAARSPGAMERTVSAPVGEMRGETFARFVALDGLVHGWDLSRATGHTYEVAPEVVAAVDDFARDALTPETREGGFAAPRTPPAGADQLERLVAFTGREL